MQLVETDVLVVGGGGAGLRAAIEASNLGASVALVLKGLLGSSGSTAMAAGAMAGVGSWHEVGDSVGVHFMDTVRGGAYINEQRLVRIITEEASQRIVELEGFGALWERTEDGKRYLLRIGGGHSYPRSVYFEDRPGHEMLTAMKGEALRRTNILIFENVMVTKLLTSGGSAVGATAFNLNSGRFIVFKSKATVLATGGAGQLYLITTQPVRNTGDGFALALQAGAKLMDMEFVQFYPLGLLYPEAVKGIIVGALYYGHLLNVKGERFMKKYDPKRLELSTRDLVSRAVYKEVQEGRGTKRGGVYIDMTFNPSGFIKKQLPFIYNLCMKLGVNPEKSLLEVAPTCHYFMGGVKVNDKWATNVPGLFAAGEVVGGVHGANRLSQNSLTDIIVSGARVGMYAAKSAVEKKKWIPIDEEQVKVEREKIYGMLGRKGEVKPLDVKKKIKEVMWNYVGIIRNNNGLEQALKEIENIKKVMTNVSIPLTTMRYNMGWIDAVEASNLVLAAEAIIKASLMRTETRGAHFRDDFPFRDDKNWLKHLVIELENGKMKLGSCPVDLSEVSPIKVKE
jgi:fumarate reductase (CoM/CoB) subunit A